MQAITTALKALSLGDSQAFRNLTAFPLLNPAAGPPDYITLSQAVRDGAAQITEISEGGSVPQLLLDNQGDAKILILDGEELIGAKQNRIANLTVLADANSKTVLPVSCVEAGRWHYRSDAQEERPREFRVSGIPMFHRARANKSMAVSENLKATGTHGANQSEVWDDISAKHRRMGVNSPTAAMSDSYEAHRDRVEDYVGRFRPVEHQVGVLFAIDGVIEGMDLFDANATLVKMLPKLVRSFAIDALETRRGRENRVDPEAVSRFLDRVSAAHVDEYPGVGLGTDLRLSAPLVAGGGLADGEQLIHLAAFSAPGPGPQGDRERPHDSRLQSRRYYRMRNRRNDH